MYMPITMTRSVNGDTYLRMCLNGVNNCARIFCFEEMYFAIWNIGSISVESTHHTNRAAAIDHYSERMISLYRDVTSSA